MIGAIFSGMDEQSAVVAASMDERVFTEFRRKVRRSETLSRSMEKLIGELKFSGKLTVVAQNGRVVKSGYEEYEFRNP
jgi:hypothetical protein